jgi:hypothetical protein
MARVSSVLLFLVFFTAPASFAQRAAVPAQALDDNLGQAETATSCKKPVSPSIPEPAISKRLERQLNGDMRRYFEELGRFALCIRTEYRAAKAGNAPETELLRLVAANNAAVKEVEELAAIYEERIGPITELVSAPPRPGDPWAGRPWPGTDPYRFPSYVQSPTSIANGQ